MEASHFNLSDADKPYVPATCCVTNQYGDYVNKQLCQTNSQGPPGQNSGDRNTALHYRVSSLLILFMGIN